MLLKNQAQPARLSFLFPANARQIDEWAPDNSKQQCWRRLLASWAAWRGDVLLYAIGSARQALRFIIY